MPLGSCMQNGPWVRRWSDVIDPSNTKPTDPAPGPGGQPPWGRMAGAEPRRVLSFQLAAPTRRWPAAEPSGLETQPQVQAAQAVGRTCSSSASRRISAAG